MVAIGDILNVIILIGGIIIGLSIVGVLGWMYLQKKRYEQFRVTIYEKDAFGNTVMTEDKAGVFVDRKTKNKLLYLKKNKNVAMNPDTIPYIRDEYGKKIIHLKRYGLKNFVYITPKFDKETMYFSVGEEDVNWAINMYEKQKISLFSDKLMQYMPFMVLGFVSLAIMVIFIYFFRSFDTLSDVGQAMTEAASAIRDANSGTQVIPG